MNKRQARAYVLRVLAAETRHHVGNGSEWIERPLGADGFTVGDDGEFTPADRERIEAAVEDIADELERRAKRLGAKP